MFRRWQNSETLGPSAAKGSNSMIWRRMDEGRDLGIPHYQNRGSCRDFGTDPCVFKVVRHPVNRVLRHGVNKVMRQAVNTVVRQHIPTRRTAANIKRYSPETQLFKEYSDNEDFKKWFEDAVFRATYRKIA